MARIEPLVLFPVVWPAELDGTRDVVAWVVRAIETNHRYMAALAEIGRRNGGGGYVLVRRERLKSGNDVPLSFDVDGQRWTGTTHVARWVRGMAVLGEYMGDTTTHWRNLKRPATQTEFTLAVVADKETAGCVCLWTLRAGDGGMLADHLTALERGGLDATTAVVVAMDGGADNTTSLVIS